MCFQSSTFIHGVKQIIRYIETDRKIYVDRIISQHSVVLQTLERQKLWRVAKWWISRYILTHRYIHTYIHTYMHIYIHTYRIHT